MEIRELLTKLVKETRGDAAYDKMPVDIGSLRKWLVQAGVIESIEKQCPCGEDCLCHSVEPAGSVSRPCYAPTSEFYEFTHVDTVCKGQIRFFDVEKQFGFIKPDDGSMDIFVHKNSLGELDEKLLLPEVKVTYVAERRKKGLRAVSLTLEPA